MKAERKLVFRLGGAILVLFLLIYYWGNISGFFLGLCTAAIPLITGFVIAYVVNILMAFYERLYAPKAKSRFVTLSRRPVCLLLAFLSLALIVVGIIVLIVPELISSVQLLGVEIPAFWSRAVIWLEGRLSPEQWSSLESVLGDMNMSLNWNEILRKAVDGLMSGVSGAMGTVVTVITQAFSTVVTVLVGMIFSTYLLFSKEKLLGQLDRVARHYLKPNWYERLIYIRNIFDHSFRKFIVGQCIEAVILGVLCMLGMHLFGFPYANMIGTLVGFTALIPVAGAYIGAIVGAFLILTISPVQALLFLVFIVVLQQLEGNIIYPRVVGASIGLPGVWVLAAITVGGGLLGIGGMFLAVPMAAGLYQILKDDVNHGRTMEERLASPPEAVRVPAKESPAPKPPQKKKSEKA